MPYRKISDDLKIRALVLNCAGWDASQITFALGVSRDSVDRWLSRPVDRALKTRTLLQGRPRKLYGEALEYALDLIEASPSLYLDEIAHSLKHHYNVSISLSALHRTLTSLGYTLKRLRKIPAQRDEVLRTQWKATITSRFTANQLVFADESSKDDRTAHRNYGRALAGERACEILSLNRGIRYSVLPALTVDGILTVRVVRGSVDGAEFYDWVISDLIPKMNPFPGPNSVLVIDNCATHKSPAVRDAIEAAGCLLFFLPPYSPDLNPIEEAFSCLKYYLRRHRRELLEEDTAPEIQLMEACVAAVSPEKARGWYTHSGYTVV